MPAPPSLNKRLVTRLPSWAQDHVRDLTTYLEARHSRRRSSHPKAQAEPYWVALPQWLRNSPRFGGRRRVDSRFFSDVTLGQYCLFLFARLHDDVVDGHDGSLSLVYVGDDLLIESQRYFAKHVDNSAFWRLFRDCVGSSIRAAIDVDARQRRPGAMHRKSLTLYARMCALLKVGTAAMCVKYDRMRDFPRLSTFADELAIAGQILDDVLDLQQDLAQGRFTFAANCLSLDLAANDGDIGTRITRSVLLEDGLGSVATHIERHVERAARAIQPLAIPEATAHIEGRRRELQAFEASVHRARVEHLLGPLVKSRAKTDTSARQPAGDRGASSSPLRDLAS